VAGYGAMFYPGHPSVGESGSRFSITNISANSKPKSERLEMECKGPVPNRLMQKTPENPPHCHVPLIIFLSLRSFQIVEKPGSFCFDVQNALISKDHFASF
jgi:hypothetical protein